MALEDPKDHRLRTEAFQGTPLFAPLDAEERFSIASLSIEKRFGAGEILFLEGAPCEGLYIIGAGTVKIVKTAPSGREIMLGIETAPSSVAEVPLFDGGAYPATVTALEETIAFVVLKEDFRRVCHAHPEVPLKVLSVVGRRLRHLVSLIESVTFGSVRQRLARTLLEMARESGGASMTVLVSHEELAQRLGTVREVVSRNLARFQAEGCVRVERREIGILDEGALRAEAEAPY